MRGPIKGFHEPSGWARAARFVLALGLLGGAVVCVLTLTPPPRDEWASPGIAAHLLGAVVGLAGAAILVAAASTPKPVYARRQTPRVRPARIALRCIAPLSMLLCLGFSALWVRSYSGSDYLSRRVPVGGGVGSAGSRIHRITWTHGIIRLALVDQTVESPGHIGPLSSPQPQAVWGYGRLGPRHVGWYSPAGASFWNRLGFGAYETASAASFYFEREHGVALPAWLPVAGFAPVPLVLLRQTLTKRSRLRAGRCVGCGYDLRATAGNCPECGSKVPARLVENSEPLCPDVLSHRRTLSCPTPQDSLR